MGSTTVSLAGLRHKFEAVQLPDIQREPEFGDGWVRFVQTTGGRTGYPLPVGSGASPSSSGRRPLVWTTLSLTLHVDGRTSRLWLAPAASPATGSTTPATSLAQVGAHRLQGLVPPVVRTAHPMGRPGLRGARDRGGDGTRALALRPGHGWKGKVKIDASRRAPLLTKQGEHGYRGLPRPRRGDPGRTRRRAPGRVRPRRPPRGAGPSRRWRPNVDARSRHAVPGRHRRGRPAGALGPSRTL
jgi:hypothetical protein